MEGNIQNELNEKARQCDEPSIKTKLLFCDIN